MQQERFSHPARSASSFRPTGLLLQRKCACGQHTIGGGTCSGCAKKEQALLRRPAPGSQVGRGATVPESVHETLRSPGRPLDADTRAFMESRFGHDFSRVRVHTDSRAAESARAVDALAYTVRSDIVFGSHQYAPASPAGRALLAHELAHVMQQEQATSGTTVTRISQPSDSGEANAEHLSRSALAGGRATPRVSASPPVLSRRVIPRLVHCTAGADGAPADPVAELTGVVDRAEGMAAQSATALREVAALTRAGDRPVGAPAEQAFDNRFGEPPEVSGGGFLNRLTGAVRPSLDVALSEEMSLIARRYDMIAGQFRKGFIHYLCMSTVRTFGSCTITDCSRNAWACPGVNAIFLCPPFWGGDPRTSATLLIHEAAHMIWEEVGHGAPGSGGNFRHAECYARLVADVFDMGLEEGECPTTGT